MIATAATGSLSRTVGMMASLMGPQSQLGAPSQRPHPKERPLIKAQLDSAKYLKQMSGAFLGKAGLSFSMGAMLRQSTIMNTTMGTIAQLQGHATDIILAPFLPAIAASLGFIVHDFLPGLQNFIDDPAGWLGTVLKNFGEDVKMETAQDAMGKYGYSDRTTDPTGRNPWANMDPTGARAIATAIGHDEMAGEFADRQAHIIATATDLWAQPLIRASERATVYADSKLIAAAEQREQRDLQIQQDASMMVDFEYQQAYEMNKAMTTFNNNRQESYVTQYAQDDMVGFY